MRIKDNIVYNGVAAATLILIALPVGIAVFIFGFFLGDSPCVLCWQERMGMVLASAVGLFILRYGVRLRYIGLLFFIATYGIYSTARHLTSHIARDVGQGFSIDVFSIHTYSWAFFVYWVILITASLMMLFVHEDIFRNAKVRAITGFHKFVFIVFVVVVLGNTFQAITSTGIPPYMGQGDPVRYSLNPTTWVWSMEAWKWRGFSLRSSFDVEEPTLTSQNMKTYDIGSSSSSLNTLSIKSSTVISSVKSNPLTDIDYNPANERFALTGENGYTVYLMDKDLDQIITSTKIDPYFAVQINPFSGVAFIQDDVIMANGYNKSYVILEYNKDADRKENFRYFKKAGDFDELRRSRLSTVRAKMQHVLSLDYDSTTGYFYTVTVPNRFNKKLVVSKFDYSDRTLSSEFQIKLNNTLFAELDLPYITGITVEDDKIYALSRNYSAIFVIDLNTQGITDAYKLDGGIKNPIGITVKDGDFHILSYSDKQNTVYAVEKP